MNKHSILQIIVLVLIVGVFAGFVFRYGTASMAFRGSSQSNTSTVFNTDSSVHVAESLEKKPTSLSSSFYVDDQRDTVFSDDNSGENLIIKTDKENYEASAHVPVYFSIENKGNQTQNVHVQFYFPRSANVKLIHLQQKTENGWEDRESYFGYVVQPKKYSVTKPIPKDLVVKGSFNFVLPGNESDQVTNFRIILDFEETSLGEFWIEGIGDNGAYGLLDPGFHVVIRGGGSGNGVKVRGGAAPSTSGFLYYRSITVNSSQVPSTQTNFPMLVSGTYSYLKTEANGGKVKNSNGYDVGFYSSSDCATGKLSWETETYTASSGVVNYWVKVPSIQNGSVIYMCYANSTISTDQSAATSVWDSNYKGVWHLPDGSSLSANDSTGSNNGSLISTPTATTGQVGGAASFAPSQYISVANGGGINNTTSYTIELWVRWTSTSQQAGFASAIFGAVTARQKDGNWTQNMIGLDGTNPTTAHVEFNPYTYNIGLVGSTAVGLNTWRHIMVTSNGSNQVIYLNGAQDGTGSVSGSGQNDTSIPFTIGAWIGAGSSYSTSNIDEVRVSDTVRGADWAATSYNNQSAPSSFYSVSAENTSIQPLSVPMVKFR